MKEDGNVQTQPQTQGNGKTLVDMKDMTEIRVVAVFLVQKLGSPTIDELIEAAREKLFVRIHRSTLRRALEGAARANLVAINQASTEGGQRATVFNMKDMYRWKSPPEYAHIGDLLPKLLDSAGAAGILAAFNAQEGEGAKKKQRGNIIDDFHAFVVHGRLLQPMLGSQIPHPEALARRAKLAGKNDLDPKVEVDLIFDREPETGAYLLSADVLRAWWMGSAARIAGMAKTTAGYIAFSPARIVPKQRVVQMVLPTNPADGRPAAPKKFEAIQAGEEIEIRFSAPTKGWFTPEQTEKLFITSALRARRAFSPSMGIRYGRFLVTSFEDLGAVKECGLDYLVGDIPESILKGDDGAYFKAACARLKDVGIGFGGKAAPVTEEEEEGEAA